MENEFQLNPLVSVDRAQKRTDDTFEQIRREAAAGKLVAWSGAVPDLLRAMDIAIVREGPYSHRARREGIASMFIQVAEAEGFSTDICSYFKIMLGVALLMRRGQEERIPEKFRVPPPDIVIYDSGCPIRNQFGEAVADIFKVPFYTFDYPYTYDPTHWQRDMDHVLEQLKDLVSFLEEKTGHPLKIDALRKRLVERRNINQVLRKLKKVTQRIPAPVDYGELLLCSAPFLVGSPEPGVVEYCQQIEAELEERIQAGIGFVSPEKHRLLWVGFPTWGEERSISRMLAKKGAVVVSAHMGGLRVYGQEIEEELPPDGFDVDRPLFTAGAYFGSMFCQRPLDWKMKKWVYDYLGIQLEFILHGSLLRDTALGG